MPPVNERVQEAPAGTLRAAFAGIGRFLKITDKIRNKPAAGETPVAAKATAVPEATAKPETAADAKAPESPAAPEPAAPEPAAEAVTGKSAVASPDTRVPEVPEPAAELPLANYDSLTIASVRARLRNLSVAQLGELLEYEKSHAGRADFIAAFERRIAKVEPEG